MKFSDALRQSVVAQFGAQIQAGRHSEYPRLKEIWLEEKAARAEEAALICACDEVSGPRFYR
jgi:hypothetical protein